MYLMSQTSNTHNMCILLQTSNDSNCVAAGNPYSSVAPSLRRSAVALLLMLTYFVYMCFDVVYMCFGCCLHVADVSYMSRAHKNWRLE